MQNEFNSFENFYKYAIQYSVFDRDDLKKWYDKGKCKLIKMTYNVALKKRIIRHELIEEIGLPRDIYWGFFELSDKAFNEIVIRGGVKNILI